MKQKIIAVIPALNEENTIAEVLKSIKKFVDKTIVVDDGSKDKTQMISKENSAIVVSHDTNMGYDKSIDDGFKEAIKYNPTVIFTFDADGQHNSSDIQKFINPIIEKKADVVVGIRPKKQRLSENLFSHYSRKRIGIGDPLCGIKSYSAEAYKKVGYFDKLNSIGTELMFNCYKYGYKIIEVKVGMNTRQDTPRFGNKIKSNLRILNALIKIYFKFR